MVENKRWLLGIIIFCAAVLYFLFLTQGLPLLIESEFPFGLSDRFQNYKNTVEIIKKVVQFVPSGLQYYDRPVRVLFFRLTYPFLGLNPFGYHLIRGILLASITLLIMSLLGRKKWFAVCAGLFYLLSPPTYLEGIDLEDIGLVVEFLIFCCFYLFLKVYNREKSRRNKPLFYLIQILIVVFSVIANGSKGNARIIPFVFLSFIIIDDRKKLRSYLPLILILFLNVLPFDYFLKGSSGIRQLVSELPYGIYFSRISNLFIFNPTHNTFFGASLAGVMGILNIWLIAACVVFAFRKKLSKEFPLTFNLQEISRVDRSLVCFSGVWLFWTVITSVVYLYSEPQRLTNSLMPAAVLIFLLFYYLENSFKGRQKFIIGIFMFCSVILTEGLNLGKTLVLRSRNTSYLIAQENLNNFIEQKDKARNSLVLVFRAGVKRTQGRLNSSNTYLPALGTNLAGPGLNTLPVDNREYENIYIVSGCGPVKNAAIKGLKYLSSVNCLSDSILDRVKGLLRIPASYTFYVYKYTGKTLPGRPEKEGIIFHDEKAALLTDLDISGDYIFADFDFGYSGRLRLKKVGRDQVQVLMMIDNNWGEEIRCLSGITNNRIRVEISKENIIEIAFKKDKSFVGDWREGKMEQKQGRIFGRLADSD